MFSSTAEYALRAVVYLATHRDGLVSSHTIAQATQVPPKYASKVLQDLVTAGIITSRRGPSGGFSLARSADKLSVLDVLNAVDPFHRIQTCPLGIPSHGKRLCRLHRTLDDTIAKVEETLRHATIEDMITPSKDDAKWTFPTVRGASIQPPRQG
jgi:Rrf2 family protein